MSKIINIEKRGNGVYLAFIHAPIDLDTYTEIRSALTPLLATSTRVLILNMKGVKYISSVGIGIILKAKIYLEDIGSKFIMIELQPQIQTVFEIIKALPGMQVFENIQEVEDYFMKIQKDEIEKTEK